MKKTGMRAVEQRAAAIRPLPKKYYDPSRTLSFLARVRNFYQNRPKRYEVQLEVVLSLPYRVTASSAQEASDIIRDLWVNGEAFLSTDDISYVAITTFRNGTKEKDVVL